MSTFSKVFLRKGKEDSVRRFHPWIFSGAVLRTEGTVSEGDIVEVYSFAGDYLATGHIQNGSIAIRIFDFVRCRPDGDYWHKRLKSAAAYRQAMGCSPSETTNAYRLVFGEGDGLPGLVVDYYNGTAVIQCHSAGMQIASPEIAKALTQLPGWPTDAVYLKCPEPAESGYLSGKQGKGLISENGMKFVVDWEGGQKTGFFLDQRVNRWLLQGCSQGKTVLNTFSYTGGFSVAALRGGASRVVSVDSSRKAIELCTENLQLNGYDPGAHDCMEQDTQKFLQDCDETFDIIVLDPPAFAKHLDARHRAVQAYKRLNSSALRRIKPGGLLFTFSCSQVVGAQLFFNTIHAAAIEAGRRVRIAARLSQPPDHPVSAFHPEGEYLKGLLLAVDND